MRWLDSITDPMDMNLRKFQKITKDREAWCAKPPFIVLQALYEI